MTTILFLATLALGADAPADWTRHFKQLPPEREQIRDPQTGREITFLTSAASTSTLYYPTCRSWTADDRYVLFESIRPRPGEKEIRSRAVKSGAKALATQPAHTLLERQLMAADTLSGNLYWLASLEVEETSGYGEAQLITSSQFHADYSPGSHRIVYYDMTGHHLYLLDLASGQRRELWHMKDGTIGDPPSIAVDGSRVIFYAAHPGPAENEWFRGDTFTIYAIDIDVKKGTPTGPPYIVTSYTSRKGPHFTKDNRDWVVINHCQINPKDNDLIGYAHQQGYSWSDGNPLTARMWSCRIDGSQEGFLMLTPTRHYHTHEVWGAGGEWMYFVDTAEVSRVNVKTHVVQEITHGPPRTWANHIAVSPDEKTIIADTFTRRPFDADGTLVEPLLKIDVASGRMEELARQSVGQMHPRHAHPNLSTDGRQVGFTVASGKTARVAIMTIGPKSP